MIDVYSAIIHAQQSKFKSPAALTADMMLPVSFPTFFLECAYSTFKLSGLCGEAGRSKIIRFSQLYFVQCFIDVASFLIALFHPLNTHKLPVFGPSRVISTLTPATPHSPLCPLKQLLHSSLVVLINYYMRQPAVVHLRYHSAKPCYLVSDTGPTIAV